MKISGDWLAAKGTRALCAALSAGGHQALFVGGCVRNALLGKPVADIDIATDAPPQRVQDLAQAAGFRVVPTGIDHGTLTVIAQGVAHEVTTFRRDVETDGRRATIAFSTSIQEDAARRDFTMNALYADADGLVIDPLGGLPDLLARRLRFVGDAQTRIREDALRILRFFRFHAHYGDPMGGIDPEGLAACAAQAELIGRLSGERIGHEMRKLLAAPDPAPAVAAMAAAGVLAQVMPGAEAAALAPLVHHEAGKLPQDGSIWQGRLLVLGGSLDRLRLSRAEAQLQNRMRDSLGAMSSPAVLGHQLGAAAAGWVVLARAALFSAPTPLGWQAETVRGENSRFPVTAADLAPLQGAALGARLKALMTAWEASNLTASKGDLLQNPA